MINPFKDSYRIIEINGIFIPQIRIGIFGGWHGISRDEDVYRSNRAYQIKWCSHRTIEEADMRIKN